MENRLYVNAAVHTALFQCRSYKSQIYFADETGRQVAREIVPGVRVQAAEVDACLVLLEVVRLTGVPVGVGHRRHGVGAGARRRDAPDERRVASRVDALTRRPEVDALNSVSSAFAQRRLCSSQTTRRS